jgi:hypothetical protein
MSALLPKADIETQSRDVRLVPKADISIAYCTDPLAGGGSELRNRR